MKKINKSNVNVYVINENLTQKENECSGAYAIYHKIDQILELSGNAQVKQKKDTFRAQNIYFNMDTEEIKLGGNVKGSVTDTKESDTKEPIQQNKTDSKETKKQETQMTNSEN